MQVLFSIICGIALWFMKKLFGYVINPKPKSIPLDHEPKTFLQILSEEKISFIIFVIESIRSIFTLKLLCTTPPIRKISPLSSNMVLAQDKELRSIVNWSIWHQLWPLSYLTIHIAGCLFLGCNPFILQHLFYSANFVPFVQYAQSFFIPKEKKSSVNLYIYNLQKKHIDKFSVWAASFATLFFTAPRPSEFVTNASSAILYSYTKDGLAPLAMYTAEKYFAASNILR